MNNTHPVIDIHVAAWMFALSLVFLLWLAVKGSLSGSTEHARLGMLCGLLISLAGVMVPFMVALALCKEWWR